MPYTFAHIGFVIPLKRKWNHYFSETGLVFGSIAPDFDILFRFTENRFHLFDYDLYTILFLIYPLALISALVFHLFCRTVVIRFLPEFFRKKYNPLLKINVKELFKQHFISISFSIVFAILLHLSLDNLCHIFNAYFVKIFVLKYTANKQLAIWSYYAAIYLLPVLFTLAGFVLLYKNLISPDIKLSDFYLSREKITFWSGITFFTLIIISLKVILSSIEKEFIIDFFLITITSSFIAAFYLVCIIYYFYLKREPKKNHLMAATINGLWIQGKLSSLELLTVTSYLAHGFNFQLWTYEPETINAPEKTIVRNANEIIPFEKVFSYNNKNIHGHGKGSYAGFSDIFRYKLLYEHGGIWTDMDITCLKSFDIKEDYFFRYHAHAGAVGNFMKCPKNSSVMQWCYEQAADKVDEHNKDWMLPIQLLNEGIQRNNLNGFIHKISNNDSFPEVADLLSNDVNIPDDWIIIHWMNEEWRRFKLDKNFALPDSTYYKLLVQYNIPFVTSGFISRWKYKLKMNRLYYTLMSIYSIYKFKVFGVES